VHREAQSTHAGLPSLGAPSVTDYPWPGVDSRKQTRSTHSSLSMPGPSSDKGKQRREREMGPVPAGIQLPAALNGDHCPAAAGCSAGIGDWQRL